MKTLAIFLCSWLVCALAVQAELSFAAKSAERKAKVGEASVVADFKFTNKGKKPATISLIDSSCGCLKAKSDKTTYQPGESGVIQTEFFVKGLTGTLEKFIHIRTSTSNTPTRLVVKVSIPEILSIEPKMADWNIGEGSKAKRVVFKVLRPQPIRILEVVPSRKSVTAKLYTVEEGRHYEIELTPGDTSKTLLGVVRIETDCEIPEQKRQMAFFRIARDD